MKRLCIFCGSKPGRSDIYCVTAGKVGRILAEKGIGIVYGGGRDGCMGAVADGALRAGGDVIGVMPRALQGKEVPHPGMTVFHQVGSMHERKALMADLSDGFIALPGGMGTLEEFCEAVTWSQLGIHRKPFGLLNIGGYFDLFIAFLDHAVAEGFFHPNHRQAIVVEHDAEKLLEAMQVTPLMNGEQLIARNES